MEKKRIFIINSHWNNRGDEAALRSLIDSLLDHGYEVSVQLCSPEINNFPYKNVKCLAEYPRVRHIPDFILGIFTKHFFVSKKGKAFFNEIEKADLVLHGPGGPSIGDVYYKKEICYLLRLWAAIRNNKPFIICAPSAGPFLKKKRNRFRRFIFNNANKIILREEISKKYLDQLLLNNDAIVAYDLALQNEIEVASNEKIFMEDNDLVSFMKTGEKIIGITMTDLQWHPQYAGKEGVKEKIEETFEEIVFWFTKRGYKVLFIPQLFGRGNDYDYMSRFCNNKCFVLSDHYDCYFQQYIISKLYAVVGMRYHSNIFSAKMMIPFISVSYEQKMKGFINKIGFDNYCIDIEELSKESIIESFISLEEHYMEIRERLEGINASLKQGSRKTIEIIFDFLEKGD